ncbi:hypothetical protein [Bradyrhizobium valentinum]|uniref:DUF308 domain-containing protein n=1 Tax=Bradyrhizobium valentinum TaxID=1518501 RepID=A0A0R3KNT4_9BRAD|nr:hypothetical protein [Bradyrhizobium valentinum]KRQ95100.1 hypothetical protein CP49_29990 [Bradyrhizobium valentinum]KRQ97663.1 hypothetical protein CQ10_28940 [Bradyrhizobium valentinum]
MMVVMLIAGIGLVLAGLLAIGSGIPIKEFSTGNTLIIAGVIGVCSGAIMLALWMTVRELKNIARRLGTGVLEARSDVTMRQALPVASPRDSASIGGGFPAAEQPGGPMAAPPPWQNEAVLRDHPVPEPMFPEDAAPPPPPSASKPKRNLLFSSTSRKERERAQARAGEPLPPDLLSSDLRSKPPAVPPVESAEPPPPSFEDTWPKADRAKPGETPLQRRGGRTPPSLTETNGGPARSEDQPAVTVLKSGVVDGMAYSLYSDGSIEAQMPEGMMRFASIDELRAHLDQRH